MHTTFRVTSQLSYLVLVINILSKVNKDANLKLGNAKFVNDKINVVKNFTFFTNRHTFVALKVPTWGIQTASIDSLLLAPFPERLGCGALKSCSSS